MLLQLWRESKRVDQLYIQPSIKKSCQYVSKIKDTLLQYFIENEVNLRLFLEIAIKNY